MYDKIHYNIKNKKNNKKNKKTRTYYTYYISTGSSPECFVTTYMEKESEKEQICVCV